MKILKYTKYTEATDPKILFVTSSTFYASLNIITSPRGSFNYGRIITNQNKIKYCTFLQMDVAQEFVYTTSRYI